MHNHAAQHYKISTAFTNPYKRLERFTQKSSDHGTLNVYNFWYGHYRFTYNKELIWFNAPYSSYFFKLISSWLLTSFFPYYIYSKWFILRIKFQLKHWPHAQILTLILSSSKEPILHHYFLHLPKFITFKTIF